MNDGRYYEPARHDFTPDELRGLGEELARETQLVIDLQEQKKEATAVISAQIKQHQNKAAKLALRLNDRYELRPTEVLILFNVPRIGIKRFIRADNNLVLHDDPMTTMEMQSSFGFDESEIGGESEGKA